MKTKYDAVRYWQRMICLMGLFKIPMIGYLKPKVLSISEDAVSVKIRLRRRSKNHLNSMYFGALAVGADLCAGLHAFYFTKKMQKNVSFAFKSMDAEFLKRAETHVFFHCNDGQLIKDAVEKSSVSGERINQRVRVEAKNEAGELVAIFHMESSVKVKG